MSRLSAIVKGDLNRLGSVVIWMNCRRKGKDTAQETSPVKTSSSKKESILSCSAMDYTAE